jgi:DNA-directed RNA polymerase specialized sigma24 family protein
MDANVYEALRAVDLGNMVSRLMAHGLDIARARGNRLSKQDVEDAVGLVLEAIWQGKVKWDPDRGPLHPLAKCVLERRLVDMTRKKTRSSHDALDALLAGDANPEEVYLEVERGLEISARIGELFACCDSDPEAMEVLQCVLDGVEPRPRFIADAVGKSVAEVNTTLRRMRRRALAFDTTGGSNGEGGAND